jgi:hypothetical protein
MEKDHITVDGHIGTWYVIDEGFYKGKQVYLLEHEKYGDEAACLIIDKDYNILLDDVRNGFDDLELLDD